MCVCVCKCLRARARVCACVYVRGWVPACEQENKEVYSFVGLSLFHKGHEHPAHFILRVTFYMHLIITYSSNTHKYRVLESFLIMVYDLNIIRKTRIPKPHADGMLIF